MERFKSYRRRSLHSSVQFLSNWISWDSLGVFVAHPVILIVSPSFCQNESQGLEYCLEMWMDRSASFGMILQSRWDRFATWKAGIKCPHLFIKKHPVMFFLYEGYILSVLLTSGCHHQTSLKNPGWTYGTFCWIYSNWSSVLWKLHEIPKDALHPSHVFVCALVFAQKKSALASCFHDLISKVCMKNCFPIVNHPSPESFPNTIDRWQVKPMLFPEFWAPIGGFAGRQLPEALQLERVEIKVPWGKVSREFLDSWIDRKTWSVIVFFCLYQTLELGRA